MTREEAARIATKESRKTYDRLMREYRRENPYDYIPPHLAAEWKRQAHRRFREVMQEHTA